MPATEKICLGKDVQLKRRSHVLQSRGPTLAAGIDNKPESLLFFEGASRVHGLFEYLLCEHSSSTELADVPLLLAPVPFLGATLHQLQPQVGMTGSALAALSLLHRPVARLCRHDM